MSIIIASLIAIGLALLIVEIIFIPGTTVVGILGLIFCGAAVLVAFRHFGNETGFWVLAGTLAASGAALIYSFRSGAWDKLALKTSIQSKVNEGHTAHLRVGDEGITKSVLRPMGKAEFNDLQFEVRTTGAYVEAQKKVKIILVDANQIIVEPVN